jgi:WD40 repeat protein
MSGKYVLDGRETCSCAAKSVCRQLNQWFGIRVSHPYLFPGASMNRQFPVARFSRATQRLGIAALYLALSAPLSAQESSPLAVLDVGAVESVSFSPNGKTLVSTSGVRTIKLWDVASGRNTATLKEEGLGAKDLPYEWATVAFSPDGKKFAAGGWFNRVKVWDLATLKGQVLLDDYLQCPETLVVFSSDGKYLASGGVCRSQMKLFDVATGKTAATFERTSNQGVLAIAFTPDNKTLVSVSGIAFTDDREIKRWDVATGKNTATLKMGDYHEPAVLSSDAKSMAAATYDDNNNVKVWDVATGKERGVLKGHAAEVTSLAFSPDGKTLVSGDDKGTIKLWDVTGGKELASFTGHAGKVLCLAISADGKVLASGGQDKKIKLWNTAKEE